LCSLGFTGFDYHPFGMTMPGRGSGTAGRYGFNGKEQDTETSSTSTYDYGFRIYNPALGKFLSVDPLTKSYPWYSPYHYAGNSPIQNIDLDGAEPQDAQKNWQYKQTVDVRSGQAQFDRFTYHGPQLSWTTFDAVYDKVTKQHWFVNQGNDGQWYYWKHNPGAEQTKYIAGGGKDNGVWTAFTPYSKPNTSDALTAMTVGPLVAVPGLVYGAFGAPLLKAAATDYIAANLPKLYYYYLLGGSMGMKGLEFLDETGSVGAANSGSRTLIDQSRLGHIFRKAVGHFADDTPQARQALEDLASDAGNLLGGDKHGNGWYAKLNEKGQQLWAQVRDGKIINGGLNDTPKEFNAETGLSALEAPRK
jgi:RHS repeat-associated protein